MRGEPAEFATIELHVEPADDAERAPWRRWHWSVRMAYPATGRTYTVGSGFTMFRGRAIGKAAAGSDRVNRTRVDLGYPELPIINTVR